MAAFLRTNSATSLSGLGSDNEAPGKPTGKALVDQAKNKNIVQRTRDALGDIGNRLKKNQAPVPGKAGLKKDVLGPSSQFAVPTHRAPRAGGVVAAKPKPKAVEKPVAKTLSTAKPEDVAAPVLSTIQKNTLSSPKGVDTLYKPFAEGKEDKENVAEIDAASEAENEFNPRLSSDGAVESFGSSRLNIINIDADDCNPLLVNEYIKNIYDYVFDVEKKYPVRIRYLEGRMINSRMRAVLLDWLIEVHTQFGFMPETLFLASKMLDRYLQADRNITRKQLQLVGVSAMYVAAKYEEVCTPAVQDFAAVSDNAFTVSDVIKMEKTMLTALSFDLGTPPAVLFLRRFSKAANATMCIHSMAKYVMELSVVDYAACHLFPSEQAAGSLALALLILDNTKSLTDLWNPTIQHYTRFSLDAIKPIVSLLAGVVSRAQEETCKLKAVHKKYTGKRQNHTSLAPELKLENWKNRVLKEVCLVKP